MLATVFVCFAASFVTTWLVIKGLKRRDILDRPNARSSHTLPIPRGGGLACVPVLLCAWAVVGPATLLPILGLAAVLGVVSWIDDLRGLGAGTRLAAHIAAVAAFLTLHGTDAPVFGGLLPPIWDAVLSGLLWVYFLNIFNFMDGIDGIAGVEIAAIGAGVAGLAMLAHLAPEYIDFGLATVGVAAGFLVWNWHPARVFLGDVGSVPLGFLMGWLLLELARSGLWAPALILPLYYLADATITLVRRGLRGEKVWQAHKEHFYQKAHQAGWSHAQVSARIAIANVFLIGFALVAASGQIAMGLAAAAAVVAFLLYHLSTARGAERS